MSWTTPSLLSGPEMTALGLCLAASLLWAPMIWYGARALTQRGYGRERVWLAALLIAILPTLSAPVIATAGYSLRPVPEIAPIAASVTGSAAAPVILSEPGPAIAPKPLAAVAYDPALDAATPVSAGTQTVTPPAFTLGKAAGALAILYVYGAMLMGLIWLVRMGVILGTAAGARDLDDPVIEAGVDEWVDRLGASRFPIIRVTPHVSSVCLTGVIAPVILIPRDLPARVSREDVVLMCAHELAHFARGDRRLFSATQLVRVLFWFNPFIRAIAVALEGAAEEATDARVIRAGAKRRAYAACFVEGLRFARAKAAIRPPLAIAFTPTDTHDRGGRKRRLNGILYAENDTGGGWSRVGLFSAASVAGLTGLAQAALAVDPAGIEARGPIRLPMPLAGEITFGFGEKADILGPDRLSHEGIDIRAAEGADIAAPRNGIVTAIKRHDKPGVGYGKMITIDHGGGLSTRYAHLSEILVEPGDLVTAGDVIGKVGSTGKSKGPHLHFEALVNGEHVDPNGLIKLKTLGNDTTPTDDKAIKSAAAEPRSLRSSQKVASDTAKTEDADNDDANGPMSLTLTGPGGTALAATPGAIDLSALAISGLEAALLAGEALDGVDFDLRFDDGEKTTRFRSGDILSKADRETIERAIEKARADLEASGLDDRLTLDLGDVSPSDLSLKLNALVGAALTARKHAGVEKIQREAEREARIVMRDAEKARAEANKQALADLKRNRKEIDKETERARQEAFAELFEQRWEAMEARRDALANARDDIMDALRDGREEWSDALADLRDARREILEEDMPEGKRASILEEFLQSEKTLRRDKAEHQRELADALARIDEQEREIERLRQQLKEQKKG